MNVIINGENHDIAEDTTVSQLLEGLSLQPEATVVERNGEILERDTYAATVLAESDALELVRFVGGG